MRVGARIANWCMGNVLRWRFQAFVHPLGDIDRVCAEEGLTLERDDPGLLLSVRIYRRAIS